MAATSSITVFVDCDRQRGALAIVGPDVEDVHVDVGSRIALEVRALELALPHLDVNATLRVSSLGRAVVTGIAQPDRYRERIACVQDHISLFRVHVVEIDHALPQAQRAVALAGEALVKAGSEVRS